MQDFNQRLKEKMSQLHIQITNPATSLIRLEDMKAKAIKDNALKIAKSGKASEDMQRGGYTVISMYKTDLGQQEHELVPQK
jgi:hypothetical protein